MIYEVILNLKEAGHLAKRQLNLDLLVSTMVDRFSIDSPEYAKDLISARAKTVLGLMDEAKTPNLDWSRKAIYRELKTASKRKKNIENIILTPLRPRSDDKDDSFNEESEEHEELPRPRRRRVRKSLLRPKLSSVSAKQIGKRTRSAAALSHNLSDDYDNDDIDDDRRKQDAMIDDFETPSKVRGHELVRDPLSTTRAKRTRSILSDSESTAAFYQKTPLRETLHSKNTSVSGEATDLEPQTDGHDSPTDTWTCQVPDCGEVIEKSKSKRSQTLIENHRAEHEGVTQEKLDVVFAEKKLNIGLPVDNLLSRIREVGTGLPDPHMVLNGDGPAAAAAAHEVGI